MLVSLHNVGKRYGAIRALAGITAAMDGHIIGLLGPNGAGKSTLLKCLLGLIRFDGQAEVLGMSAAENSFRIRDRVGYMPETDCYLPGMNAVELCTYAAKLAGLPHREAMQRAHAALYYVGLEDKRYLHVDGYSTGMKQRVKLAQALVHDPDLLFLDEPTNGLDPRGRDEMLDLIAALPERRDCAIILSTHLLPDVERVCDQALILHDGSLRFSGAIAKLRSDGRKTRTFDVAVKQNLAELAASLEAAGCLVTVKSPLSMTVELGDDHSAHLLFARAKQHGAQIRRLEIPRESLEAAFLRVVGGQS